MEFAIVDEERGRIYTEESYEEERQELLEALYREFVAKRDKWVIHRANTGVENRWRRNTQMYYSDQDAHMDRFIETLVDGPRPSDKKTATRSKVVVNIVRPKCDQALARMAEILLPVDDRNWAIRPTPRPELSERLGKKEETILPDGTPTGLTADEEAQMLIKEAKDRCEKMQRQIDDNLNECNYNGEQRKCLSDGIILGTAVIKGPIPQFQENKKWTRKDNVYTLQMDGSMVPMSERTDPWNIYFDPAAGSNPKNGSGAFERVPNVTKKMLRRLAKTPGYDATAIAQVMMETPRVVTVAESRVTRSYLDDSGYEMWIYHGEVESEEMSVLSSRTGKPCDVEFGVLVIVNDKIIGAMKSWVVDQTIPYDVWNWRQSEHSPYGYGLPDELFHQQSVINSAWRQVMDNARFSMGGQIVMRRNKLIPADGKWEITPGKIWHAKDDVDNVNNAFAIYEFNSHVEELMAVVNAAMALADGETSMPQLLSGNVAPTTPETLGGQVLHYNNASAVLRMRVKLYDDGITKPHISRYYDHHMYYSEDESIKGDYEVDARGSSALVERDLQNQAMINLSAITSNPRFAPWVKDEQELKAILKAFKLDPESIMKTPQEHEQDMQKAAEAGPPQDPRIVAAQMQLEATKMDIADRQQQREADAQQREQELGLKRDTLMVDQERRRMEHQDNVTQAELDRELAIAEMVQDGQMTREEAESKRRLEELKISNARELFNAEMYVKQTQGTGI